MSPEVKEAVKQDQTVETEEVKKQDQTVETEEVKKEETSTEETTGLQTEKKEGVSFEDIMSEGEPKTDIEKSKEGTPPWLQDKIDKATSKVKVAENRAKVAEEKVLQLETVQASPKEEPMVPDRDSFDTVEEYQKAYSQYQKDVNTYYAAQNTIATQTEENRVRGKANDARYMSQIEKLSEKYPDAHDLINGITWLNNESSNYNPVVKKALQESGHNARIGLFLAMNKEEGERFGNFTDSSTADREIGKLEARFENVKTNVTKAPAALNTIDSKTETVVKNVKDIKDSNEWFKARNKEMREKQGVK